MTNEKIAMQMSIHDQGNGFVACLLRPDPEQEPLEIGRIARGVYPQMAKEFQQLMVRACVVTVSCALPDGAVDSVTVTREDDAAQPEVTVERPTLADEFTGVMKMLQEAIGAEKMTTREVVERRRMFYAGAHAMRKLLVDVIDLPQEEQHVYCDALDKEILDFFEALKHGN